MLLLLLLLSFNLRCFKFHLVIQIRRSNIMGSKICSVELSIHSAEHYWHRLMRLIVAFISKIVRFHHLIMFISVFFFSVGREMKFQFIINRPNAICMILIDTHSKMSESFICSIFFNSFILTILKMVLFLHRSRLMVLYALLLLLFGSFFFVGWFATENVNMLENFPLLNYDFSM